ncbi:MAG: hypothetical protein H6732_20115, partial [Alphaproteobacteria bacterium]|nr:hypothetical protein [Alphaproteobacteria bacterium]
DVFLALTRDGSVTWFTNELISHSADYPPGFLKWVFKLMGNHPGLNVNTLALLLIRGKKPVIRAYFERRLAELPPTRLVPCHGDVLEDATLPTRLAEVLARRL